LRSPMSRMAECRTERKLRFAALPHCSGRRNQLMTVTFFTHGLVLRAEVELEVVAATGPLDRGAE